MGLLDMVGPSPDAGGKIHGKVADGAGGGGYGGLKELQRKQAEELERQEQDEFELINHLASAFIICQN